jgi:predicted Zn-dependent protease with MMP-like domain
MSTIWEIPLIPHTQKMRLDIGGTYFTLHLKFNSVCNTWVMDINDTGDFTLLHGIPLVPGTDLLGQFRYMGIGGGLPMTVMTVAVGRSPDEIPIYENLGTDGHLYFETLA